MRAAVTMHHTNSHTAGDEVIYHSVCCALTNNDCAQTAPVSSPRQVLSYSCQIKVKRRASVPLLFIVSTARLFQKSDCRRSIRLRPGWGCSARPLNCIVAKWIQNWYWSPGLPRSRHYSFNKKAEKTKKGEGKGSRGESLFYSSVFWKINYHLSVSGLLQYTTEQLRK